jgi:ANTAR domain/PAS fold
VVRACREVQTVFQTEGYSVQGQADDQVLMAERSTASGSGGVERAVGAGGSQRAGWFRYFFDEDRWEWSPELQRMHGYEPGTVMPTTELVLSHKHRDDYRQIADTLELIRRTRQAFSSRHRIHDVHARVHHVVVVGDELRDDDGQVIGTHGFYIDLTPEENARQDRLTAALTAITERRSAIEQAKGMLMLVYNMDAGAAFELLKWRSQDSNVKLRRLAEQIVTDFSGVPHDGTMPPQSVYDHLLLTADQRASRHEPN